MTSTHDLISSIPGYMIPIISTKILGSPVDQRALAENLSDTERLGKVLTDLFERQRTLLMDLHELGDHVSWDVLARIYGNSLDEMRSDLEELGIRGLVFQSGLSGRDPVILLPSLGSILESLKSQYFTDVGEINWKDPRKQSLWGHMTMINALYVGKIRCKAGLEPFKKGWEYLDEKLSAVLDVKKIYQELVELGCLKEKSGTVTPVQRSVTSLALEGDSRYSLWRFCQSCRPYPGLDYQVFVTVNEKGVRKDFLARSLTLWAANRDDTIDDARLVVEGLLDLWLDLGVIQEDTTESWIRLTEASASALKTGRTDTAIHPYSEEAIIQPTMEMLVPGDFDTMDLLNIGEIADLIQADVVSIYRITRESVFRALQEGWNIDKILNFIDRISRHALPENVLINISGWAKTHAEAHIIKGTFLVYGGDKMTLPKGLDEVLPGIFRLPERCEEDISLFLEKKGVMTRSAEGAREGDGDIDWGKALPLKQPQRSFMKASHKGGVYPFGMVMPLPYGQRRETLFEEALQQGRTLIIFYPRQGYGEIQARKISPLYIFRRGGMPFMEAFCEDTDEGEIFDISKVKAIFRDQ